MRRAGAGVAARHGAAPLGRVRRLAGDGCGCIGRCVWAGCSQPRQACRRSRRAVRVPACCTGHRQTLPVAILAPSFPSDQVDDGDEDDDFEIYDSEEEAEEEGAGPSRGASAPAARRRGPTRGPGAPGSKAGGGAAKAAKPAKAPGRGAQRSGSSGGGGRGRGRAKSAPAAAAVRWAVAALAGPLPLQAAPAACCLLRSTVTAPHAWRAPGPLCPGAPHLPPPCSMLLQAGRRRSRTEFGEDEDLEEEWISEVGRLGCLMAAGGARLFGLRCCAPCSGLYPQLTPACSVTTPRPQDEGDTFRLGAGDEEFRDFSALQLKPDHFNRWGLGRRRGGHSSAVHVRGFVRSFGSPNGLADGAQCGPSTPLPSAHTAWALPQAAVGVP